MGMKLVQRTFFLGSGYFSGSNALWRTQVLRSKHFSETAQTEDVDMAIQQLLRWTIGWDETSLKHSGAITKEGSITCRARFGLVWTFLVRWVMTVLTVGSVYVGFPVTVYWPLRSDVWGCLITYAGFVCFVAGSVPWVLATLEAVIRAPQRGMQGVIQVFFVFLVASPFGFAAFFVFNFALQLTSCFKLSTGRVSGWEVTQRGPAKAKEVEASNGPAQDAHDALEAGRPTQEAATKPPSPTGTASASTSTATSPRSR